MKFKLTPFNILSATSLIALMALLLKIEWFYKPGQEDFTTILIALALLMLFTSFLFDQIFRKLITSLAKLWLIQVIVITLCFVLILILKATFL